MGALYVLFLLMCILFVSIFKKVRLKRQQRKQVSRSLRKIYQKFMIPLEKYESKELETIWKNLSNLISKNRYLLNQIRLLKQEKPMIEIYLIEYVRNDPSRVQAIQNQSNSISIQENGNSLLEPFFGTTQLDTKDSRVSNKSNTEECVICFEEIFDLSTKVELSNSHFFHKDCIFEWFNKSPICPTCKRPFRVGLLVKLIKKVKEELEIRRNLNDIIFIE